MSIAIDEIDYGRLTVAERLELIGRIWDSIPDDPQSLPLTEAQRLELDRRIEAADRAPEAAIPWDVALQQLRGRT